LAVQVTVVVPSANALPLTGAHVTVAVPQLSAPVAVKVTLLAQLPPDVDTLTLDGQVTVGGSVSATVTVNIHCAVLP
jgi:carbon monoxide dehydrogenase subunit G